MSMPPDLPKLFEESLFVDERQQNSCPYCGSRTSTNDHSPSRVFLDEPFPEAMRVVRACKRCNRGFSLDEEYVAAAVEVARTGSADPERLERTRLARTLRRSRALKRRLEAALEPTLFGGASLRVEWARVERVILKLARGHAAYDLGEPMIHAPESVRIAPFESMTSEERERFEQPPPQLAWPEIGSRAFIHASFGRHHYGWQVIQEGRYRYLASASPFVIRLVLSEYLAAEVRW